MCISLVPRPSIREGKSGLGPGQLSWEDAQSVVRVCSRMCVLESKYYARQKWSCLMNVMSPYTIKPTRSSVCAAHIFHVYVHIQ
jgi:hypothetical protein